MQKVSPPESEANEANSIPPFGKGFAPKVLKLTFSKCQPSAVGMTDISWQGFQFLQMVDGCLSRQIFGMISMIQQHFLFRNHLKIPIIISVGSLIASH